MSATQATMKAICFGALFLGCSQKMPPAPIQDSKDSSAPEAGAPQGRVQMSQEYIDELKDEGDWYNSETAKKLVKLAKEGDEWAIRELPWPENHPFHKRGRPYFRNDGPHPDGLDFEVRWKPPSAEHPY